jgi:hypothetical protein
VEPLTRLGAALNEARVRYVTIGVAGANLWARSGHTIFTTRDYDLFLPLAAADGAYNVRAMTGSAPRDLALDLSFLGPGEWRLTGYEDGPNAHRYGADHRRVFRTVTAAERLVLRLAPGGGWAGRFARKR